MQYFYTMEGHVKRIKEMDKFMRPREKMCERGVGALSDVDLLAVVLGSGSALHDVRSLATKIDTLIEERREKTTLEELCRIPGIGPARSCRVLAAAEYFRRRFLPEGCKIRKPEDAVALVREYRDRKQEHFLVITLDGANRIIEKRVVFIGTLNASMVHPREVFALAISDRAASIILVHNHPSGQLEPSREDIALTERLRKGADLLGIDIMDHIIITADTFLSMRETQPGLLKSCYA